MIGVNRQPAQVPLPIRVFGPFEITIDGTPLKPHRPADLRVLAYLILRHGVPIDRNELAACCWKTDKPTAFEAGARSYLSRTLTELSSRLGEESGRLQKPTPQTVLFDSTNADLDLLAWEAALAEGSIEALEGVASLYRDHLLLEGWNEAWVAEARVRLRNDYLRSLKSAARRQRDGGDWEAALRGFQLIYEIASWDKKIVYEWLELLWERRRFAEMEQLYKDFVAHCNREGRVCDPKLGTGYRTLQKQVRQFQSRPENGWLPVPLSHFIARPEDVRAVCDTVRSERLTSLIGTGGVGKTRLALAAAEQLRDAFFDRAWFVDLSEAMDPEEVPERVCKFLRLKEQPNQTSTEVIQTAFRSKEALLIFDNCEQVVAACAMLADRILQSCRNVKILTTSREPLDIVGEAVWRVPSLPVPDLSLCQDLKALELFGSVQLLVDRASRPQEPFTLDRDNAEAVVRICRYLEGIPLAIELAAVQIHRRFRSAQEVAESLYRSLGFLTEGSRTAPLRHQTLPAAIQWSYDLLSDAEQQVFERLGVFAGGFTEDAARMVCGHGSIRTESVWETVLALTDKSLVEIRLASRGVRRHLLQTIREFALACLARRAMLPEVLGPNEACSDTVAETHHLHLQYCVKRVEEAEPHFAGAEQAHWFDLLNEEHDNLRVALAWAQEQGGYETGLALASGLAWYWYTRDHAQEGAKWLDEFLAVTAKEPTLLRLKAIQWAGNIAYGRADFVRARAFFEEGLEIRRHFRSPLSIAIGQASLAGAVGALGNYEEALKLLEANLTYFREVGDLRNAGLALTTMGTMAYALGDFPRARDLHTESLPLLQDQQDVENVVLVSNNLIGVRIMLGELEAAHAMLPECLAACRRLGSGHRLVNCLINYITLKIHESEWQDAAVLFGFERTLRERIGYVLPNEAEQKHLADFAWVEQHLDATRLRALLSRGERMSEEELVALLLNA